MKRQVDNCVVHSSECKPLTNIQNSVQGNAQQVQKSDDEKRNRHRIRIQVYHRILSLRLSLKYIYFKMNLPHFIAALTNRKGAEISHD
jgi:hypothetical protein